MEIKEIATYKNGNTITRIFDDGTKIHATNDNAYNFAFSETVDACISERCSQGCEFCYAGCTPNGKFGNLTDWKFLTTMHPYTEVAINLQNPAPPDLMEFLYTMKAQNVIVNVTVNQDFFMHDYGLQFINFLVKMDLIKGIGISLTDPTQKNFIETVKQFPNAIIHVVAGVTHPEDIDALTGKDLKILILGYKYKGRGIAYYENHKQEIEDNIAWLESGIAELAEGFLVTSFDNLAIEQLHMREKFEDEEWDKFYAGDDGTVSFYIDLVKGTFARNSVSGISYPIGNKTMDEMFEVIKREVNESTELP